MPDAARKLPSIESVKEKADAGIPLNTAEAAVWINEKPSTLEKKRLFGTGPRFYKSVGVSGAIRYEIADLVAYKEARRRLSTSDPGPQVRPRRAPAPAIAERSTAQQRRGAAAPRKRVGTGRRS